ncbi:MAG: hypothetical protein ACK4M7_01250 [Burkholderiales bacterium]
MKNSSGLVKHILFCLLLVICSVVANAHDTVDIEGVKDMLKSGQDLVGVAAKWGGVITVVGAALALGSGRLEGALAQTVCKIFIVIGLLAAALGYFGGKIGWGFAF